MKEIILDNFPDAKVTIGECGASAVSMLKMAV